MNLRYFFALPTERKHRSRIIQAVILCVFVFYGFRASQAEILRLGYLAACILLGSGVGLLAAVIYWFVLLIHGIRAVMSRQPNGLLLFALIIGAFFAWYFPKPPLREEIKLFFNRNRYEQIVEQGRPIYLAGDRKCIEPEFKDRDLAFTCVLVEKNYAEFNIYRDLFSLVYSYDKQKPRGVDCDWNGYVWKQIDEHWFVCKSDIN